MLAGAGDEQGADLPTVRRFEAAGFRAWPASLVHYDGTWAVRLNAGHPAKRLNSVNPLDPADGANLTQRIGRAARRFAAYGRPLTFRLTPLAGPALRGHLNDAQWTLFDHSLVMRLDLGALDLERVLHRIPLQDVSRFMDALVSVHRLDPLLRPGLSELIVSIEPEAGLFVEEDDGAPAATAICVQDGDLAGLFEIATEPSLRGRGFARGAILSALKWALARGARQAWLQVDSGNGPALGLYRSLGFQPIYSYCYSRAPEA